jgi:hypothetical protein
LLRVVAQALLCNFLVCRFLLVFLMMPMMTVSGNSRLLEPATGVELPKEVFTSRVR